MELLRPKTTKGRWVFEVTDFTIRVKEWEVNNLMGDYRGCIIADLKPSLGIYNESEIIGYMEGKGARQHAFDEVVANANSICDIMNNFRGLSIDFTP